ncbi:MAG: hypothetical protein ACREN4_08355 [Candidatus Dormibacteria bacterium]
MALFGVAWAVLLLPVAGLALGYLAESRRGVAGAAATSSVLGVIAAVLLLGASVAHGGSLRSASITFWTFPVVQSPFNAVTGTLLAQNFQLGVGYAVSPAGAVLALVVELALALSQLQLLLQLRRDPRLGSLARLTSLLGLGALMVLLAPELFQALVGFEICGLVAAALVGSATGAGVGEAARRGWLVWRLGGLGLLLATGFIYVKFSGPIATAAAAVHHKTAVSPPDGLNLAALSRIWFAAHHGLATGVGGRSFSLAAALLLVAIVAAAGLFPLHSLWRSLGSGPGPVAGLLLAVAGGVVGVALLLDVYPLFRLASGALPALTILAGLASLVAAGLAARERRLRRLGIWVTASLVATSLSAFGLGSPAAGLSLLIPTCLAAVGILGLLSAMGREQRVETLEQLGAAWRLARPSALALLLGLLAVAGPLGVGTFFGRSAVLGAAWHGASPGLAAPPGLFRALGGGADVLSGLLLAWVCFRAVAVAVRGGTPKDPREARLVRRNLAQGRGLGPLWPSLLAIGLALISGILAIPGLHTLLAGFLAARPETSALPFEPVALLLALVVPLLALLGAAALPLPAGSALADPAWLAWADGTGLVRATERALLGLPAQGLGWLGGRVVRPAGDALSSGLSELLRPGGEEGSARWSGAVSLAAGLGLVIAVVIWVALGHAGAGTP